MRKSIVAIAFLAVLAPQALWGGEGKIRRSPHAVKDEYIVVLDDATPRDEVPAVAARLARQAGGRLEKVWQDALKGFFIRMNEKQAEGLSHHPDVKYIEENALMFVSATVPTNVDPACDPAPGVTCETTDNRLWHLDAVDQNAAAGTKDFSYCETGSGAYVYVVDLGVMRSHREFDNDANKVLNGFDASGDPFNLPAWNPCGGPALSPQPPDGMRSPTLARRRDHGTGVASLVAGRNLGVAREAKIVPIKVAPCIEYAARNLNSNTPNTSYATGEIVFANSSYYRVKTGGTTGPASTYPATGWPWTENPCCIWWGTVQLEYVGVGGIPREMTVQMTISGLNWILSPSNPHPKSPAVVTLSTYRLVSEAGVTSPPPGMTNSLEDAIGSLLRYNNGQGITVIASANNQNSNACDTSPGRMSRNNPANPNNALQPYKVITAGGTMLRNNPDPNPEALGGAAAAPEPAYDPLKGVRFARWRCQGGDSGSCNADINAVPEPTAPDPYNPDNRNAYIGWNMGSNGGQCVTLFAPAKNIPVANFNASNTYRNPRVSGGNASGTSWSAPIVAAAAARILQNNPSYNVDQVYDALMARTTPTLDLEKIDPPGVTGTPRNVLHLTPVVVQPLAATTQLVNGNATITASASGATGLTYALYQVNAGYDVATYPKGAYSATLTLGPQNSSSFTFPATAGTSYFVRVRSSCGTADSNITTVASPITAPTGLLASASGGTATISWNTVSGADGYRLERKVSSAAWAVVKDVEGGSTVSTTDGPSSPSGVVVYRVRARSGTTYSDPSNNDVTFVGTFSHDPIGTVTPIRAEHVTQLRAAVNGLLDIGGQSPAYGSANLDPATLVGQPVDDAHFAALMQNLNTARASVTLGATAFRTPPAVGVPISRTQIEDLRAGLK